LVESAKDAICDVVYGIATVQPNRAIKKCRIRKLRIEYYLTEIAVILVIPRSCGFCEMVDDCTDDFIMQVIEKFNEKNARYML
jgi:hypothetical protein